jgi:hypothetical protein
MQIDKTLADQALEAGLKEFPQFAEFGPTMVWRDLMEGGALMMDYAARPPQGTPNMWDFQNAVVKGYKRLAGL